MPFVAKSAAPVASAPLGVRTAYHEAVQGGTTLFSAPSPYVLTEELAAAVERCRRTSLWLRLDANDQDPGTLLLSVITGMKQRQPRFGDETLALMRRNPGPVGGWPPLFQHLAGELNEALGRDGAIVLEGAEHLSEAPSTLRLLGTRMLGAVPRDLPCIVISYSKLPDAALPRGTVCRGARDLEISGETATALFDRNVPDLPAARVRQLVALCRRQPALILALCRAAADLGAEVVEQGLQRTHRAGGLLGFLAGIRLASEDLDQQRSLGLALRLGYSHPLLTAAILGTTARVTGPWAQAFAGGWVRVRTAWQSALWSALPSRARPDDEAIHRAAELLLEQGAEEEAIRLYLEMDDSACAIRSIAAAATRLMDLGQWETLGEWLGRLPEAELAQEPWLIYDRAEICAVQGRTDLALRGFSDAAAHFTDRDNPDGACQSLLAESALMAAGLDFASAQVRALAAHTMAEGAGLLWHQVWASWQLGSLASVAGRFDDALAYFGRAVSAAGRTDDGRMLEAVSKAEQFTRRLQELHQRRELHRHAFLALEQVVQETTDGLRKLLGAALNGVDGLVDEYGWLRTPLALKLPTFDPPPPDPETLQQPGFWSRALQTLGLDRELMHRSAGSAGASIVANLVMAELDAGGDGPQPGERTAPDVLPAPIGPWLPASNVGAPADGPLLTVRLFGPFRVTLGDVAVEELMSGRGRVLFKYLLTHRDPGPSREGLMDLFWPDASPEAARNNLNVAIHGIRRALRAVADVPVVAFQNDTYRLHPDLRLWVDVEEFDRHIQAGRRLEAMGELSVAMAGYEVAIGLYQGDFLADDPYEEWPVLIRERLRLLYLDTLDRLSHLYFGQRRYASCADLCQRVVERDPCREDAQRRLMLCYSRQGQQHLALRQYRMCVKALQHELEVDPAPATTELEARIRRREPV